MFCNSCGTPLQPDYRVCPKCGLAISSQVAPVHDPERLERHIRVLGILWMIAGALFLIPAIALFVLGGAAHIMIHGNPLATMLGPLLMNIVGGTFLLLAAGGFFVGKGLTDHRPWARTAGLILGVLALFHPPFGTCLGIYTLWVLLSAGTSAQYQQIVRSA